MPWPPPVMITVFPSSFIKSLKRIWIGISDLRKPSNRLRRFINLDLWCDVGSSAVGEDLELRNCQRGRREGARSQEPGSRRSWVRKPSRKANRISRLRNTGHPVPPLGDHRLLITFRL